jgi:hypothetical protein
MVGKKKKKIPQNSQIISALKINNNNHLTNGLESSLCAKD